MKIRIENLRRTTECWVCEKYIPAGQRAATITDTKRVPVALKLVEPLHPPCMVAALRWLRKQSSQEYTNAIRRLEDRLARDKNRTTKPGKATKAQRSNA